jgi:hypothetical protein
MSSKGFAFVLSNNKGREFFIAPAANAKTCGVKHKTLEIEVNCKDGSFRVVGDKESREGDVRVLGFRRIDVTVPPNPRQLKDELGNVHMLDCVPIDCCCDCGDGWICG